MNRNRLKGTQGDQLNAVLSAAGMNFRKLLKQAAKPWRYIRWMLKQAETQLHMLFNPNTAVQPRSPNRKRLFQHRLDSALLEAAKAGNIEAVKQHLAAGTDVNAESMIELTF